MELHPKIAAIRDEIDAITKRIAGREAVCTSAIDGNHRSGSHHYKGRALDLRSKDIPRLKKHKLLDALKLGLGDVEYDIILEHEGEWNEHYHLEFDPH